MKKAIVILGIILFSFLLITSCGGKKDDEKSAEKPAEKKAKDIDVARLKEPCDFADAALIVSEEIKDLMDDNKDVKEEDISAEDKHAWKELDKKLDEIEKALIEKKIDIEVVKKCDAMKKLEEIKDEGDELIRSRQLRKFGQN
jgi:hypothetical protein